jgi:rhodanese-related sulfurtransferase
MNQQSGGRSRRLTIAVSALSVLLALFILLERRPAADHATITPDILHERLAQGDTMIFLLDVRTSEEYQSATGHLTEALLIPVQELEDRIKELEPYRTKTIVVYCRTGKRSARAVSILRREGFSALNMAGGKTSWNDRKYPVTRKDAQ